MRQWEMPKFVYHFSEKKSAMHRETHTTRRITLIGLYVGQLHWLDLLCFRCTTCRTTNKQLEMCVKAQYSPLGAVVSPVNV